ncbi:MAG: MFS transporter [Xanthobacteraceae bacterium]|uniref:MFS transporter n=1 Tax=Pseudolabrys sp. TaxID=1960880 RepID=UPI003D0EDC70
MTASAESARLRDHQPFVLFWFVRLASTIGYHMAAVAIGWKVYEITGSALDLGLIGLIQFVPAVALTLLIGHVADRYDRRLIIRLSQAAYALASLALFWSFWSGAVTRDILFAVVFVIGCARAFELPTTSALVPATVPAALIPRATAGWASANQAAVISGPALGGLIYAFSPTLVAALCVVSFAAAIVLVSLMRMERSAPKREPATLASVLAGFDYIRKRERLLGVISLDLFVILLGGATALLPIYASDILHAGPLGLGILRSAPAIGALTVVTILSHTPIERHVGLAMFGAVAMFGLSTVVFAVSTWLPLSVFALAILGASDAISVVIRFSLVQIETPDAMRGRVSAINYMFVGTSNTLGEFESGLLASWFGAVASVLIGGVGSLLVAGIWMMLFPSLRRIDRYELPPDQAKR